MVIAQTHLIEVKRFHDWGRDYLTVTSMNFAYGNKGSQPCGFELVADSMDVSVGFRAPEHGSVIVSINDISTLGMSENQFYEILDSNENTGVKLSFYPIGERSLAQIFIKKANNLPEFFIKSELTWEDIMNQKNWKREAQEFTKRRASNFKKFKVFYTELVDDDYDWFNAQTYDFVINGTDPLSDKKILEKFAESLWYMKRDTENPDVLLFVSKHADESITSTYVPPTSRTINTGSIITPQYNYLTKTYSYITRAKNKTVTEGGYTNTTTDTDIFMELAILDAKRINDPDQSTPPIIYQFTVKRHVSNPNFNIMDEYLSYASYPITLNPIECKTQTLKKEFFEPQIKIGENNVITYVKDGSIAQQEGFKEGDIIIHTKVMGRKRLYKHKEYLDIGKEYKILRNGKTYKIKPHKYIRQYESLGTYEFVRLTDEPLGE